MKFDQDGAEHFPSALDPKTLTHLLEAVSNLPSARAGIRIHGLKALETPLSSQGAIGRLPASILGAGAIPVRAVLFDKEPANNWSLGWHQDRTIVVKARHDVEGYGPWSMKAGLQHVAPPFSVLSSMITVRVHLDAVDEDNAPLLIAPGSHRLGPVLVSAIPEAVTQCGPPVACLAGAGDVWLYATPIIHASEVSMRAHRRRVLQVDYSAHPLDGGLEWLGL
jgi:hypothetical protein